MNVDLTQYVVNSWGGWREDKDNFTPSLLRLVEPDDGVTLVGPLRLRVAVRAKNHFNLLGTSVLARQAHDVYGYVLDLPPGQAWSYPSAASLVDSKAVADLVASSSGRSKAAVAALAKKPPGLVRAPWLFGANAGFEVWIRPAGPEVCGDPCGVDPCAPVDPCGPKKDDCDCGCGGKGDPCKGEELPCDFAVGNYPSPGAFFPSTCEPCAPGAPIGMPPMKGPTLIVHPARGGTLRTRYFTGMNITREDLETDWKNARLKRALMNRALGQGVVWGFGLALDGDAVCILPGYGVDCCGNDVVLSTKYRVETHALVRDPAVARLLAQPGPHRVHLLLEYFECPEQPRPVHGDPCSPATTRCETSRIRETVRLRMIPPCDPSDDGPIKRFLDGIVDTKPQPPLTHVMTPPATPPAPVPAPAALVPFTLEVVGLDDQPGEVGHLNPPLAPSPTATVEGDVFGITSRSFIKRVQYTLRWKPGYTFLGGNVQQTVPAAQPAATAPAGDGITWTDNLPTAGNLSHEFRNWSFKDTAGNLFSATNTRIDTKKTPGGGSLRMKLHVAVPASDVTVVAPPIAPPRPPAFPCLTEECDASGRPLFPVRIPWLHEDPTDPGKPADPKVLALALLYVFMASRSAQGGQAASTIAANLLAAARDAMGSIAPGRDVALAERLQKLFQDWCCALLYPGPSCECKCSPHGVVIGCASVEGGEVQMVDPWGGRRWVIHYPILSYWGQQFGIMPLDAMASKFFHFICCIAGLPLPTRRPPGGIEMPRPSVPPPIEIGRSALLYDQPERIAERIAALGVVVSETRDLSPQDFLARASDVVAGKEPDSDGPLIHYRVAGVPELHLIAPAPGGKVAPAPARSVDPKRLETFVHEALARRSSRAAVPALLRRFSEDVAGRVLRALPLEAIGADEGAVEALRRWRIASVGDLLGHDPEAVHRDVFGHQGDAELTSAIDRADTAANRAASAVGDAVVAVAKAHDVASLPALRERRLERELVRDLAERLRAGEVDTGEAVAEHAVLGALGGR